MPMTLVRRPRAASRMTKAVQNEVRKGLRTLSQTAVDMFNKETSTWSDKPTFKSKVTIADKVWTLTVSVNKRSRAGKHFVWADRGTAARGLDGGSAYPIKARTKKGMLDFYTPHHPKSMPNPPVPGFPPTHSPLHIKTKQVMHPGIYPRNFTARIKAELLSNKPGGFRSVIEASIKRGIRKNGGS